MAQAGVVAQQRAAREFGEVFGFRVDVGAVLREAAVRRVARAGHVERAARQHSAHHSHLVLGQRAGLVRADHGHGPQRLDGRKPAHHGVARGHPRRADGQGDRDDRRQALRNRRDREADHGKEEIDRRELVRQDAEEERQQPAEDDEDSDPSCELVELARQRRRDLLDAGHEGADATDLGVRRGGHDHPGGLAVRDHGARVGHAVALRDDGVLAGRRAVLVDGHRLAGQGRLVDLQVAALEQPQVGRHLVARREQDDVARHQFGCGDLMAFARPQDDRVARQHRRHGLQRALGLAFLDVADDRVDDHHAKDDRRVDVMAEQQGHDPRGQQDVDEQVVELQGEAQQGAAPRRRRQLVAAVASQPFPHFLGAQPARGGGERLQCGVGRQRVPRGRRGCHAGFGGGAHRSTLRAARSGMSASERPRALMATARGAAPCRSGRCRRRQRGSSSSRVGAAGRRRAASGPQSQARLDVRRFETSLFSRAPRGGAIGPVIDCGQASRPTAGYDRLK